MVEGISNKIYGAKAKNLMILNNKKIKVPSLITITNDLINEILFKEINLSKELLNKFILNSDEEPLFIEEIHNKIDNWSPSDKSIELIKDKINTFNCKKIILRSSNDCEDKANHSFAGIFESNISNLNINSILNSIRLILKGNYSKKLFYYSNIKKINFLPNLSIIIQEYIEGEVSGVMFIEKEKFHLNYNKGVAKSIVDGLHCEKYSDYSLNEKSNYLSKKQLKELKTIGLKIRYLFNKDQDIEWTYHNDQLYILQSRPITKDIFKENIVWDNSNIAESYSGILLPLTCSFTNYIYKEVYIDVAKSSRVSINKIEENKEIFENLLGFFSGRIYYNMTNWYKMLTLFPGYQRNKENFDLMISKKTENSLDLNYKKNVSSFFKVKYYSVLLLRLPFFQKEVNKFKFSISEYYKKLEKEDLRNLNLSELLSYYYEFKKKLLSKWYVTVENDFMAMTYFGYLKDFAKKNKINENEIISLISDISNLISAKQVDSLEEIAKNFERYTNLMNLANENKYSLCLNEINSNKKYSSLNKELIKYNKIYKGRFANELKLESENLDENPEYIIKLIYLYTKKLNNMKKKENNIKKELSNIKLSTPKKIILKYLVNKTKHYFKEREELRLLRSQAFSKVRDIFLGIGKEFEKNKIIDSKKDIFYLKLEEIIPYIEGNAIDVNFKDIIEIRKEAYKQYKNITLENYFETHIMPYQEIENIIKHSNLKNKKQFIGTPCSKGIVQGKVTVLDYFRLPKKNEKFEIVVVKHTDPGWTPLFGLVKGLIVEQGGILSHAAIVSRELHLPTVIGINNITKELKTGDFVTLNAITGEIKVGK